MKKSFTTLLASLLLFGLAAPSISFADDGYEYWYDKIENGELQRCKVYIYANGWSTEKCTPVR